MCDSMVDTRAVVKMQRKLCLVLRVLMVLGAGRGPLVSASLRAAREAGRKLKVYAVEKNPNAVIT